MEFTKGKWQADEDNVASLYESIHGNIICVIPEHIYPDSRKNWKANALLISKAPEMLDMLNKVLMHDPCHYSDTWHKLTTELKKIIKEATTL